MGCNCKNGSAKELLNRDKKEFKTNGKEIVNFILRLIGFFITLLFIPFIMLIITWFIFDMLVLNRGVSITNIMETLVEKAKFMNFEGDDDDDFYDETDELELMDVDVLK